MKLNIYVISKTTFKYKDFNMFFSRVPPLKLTVVIKIIFTYYHVHGSVEKSKKYFIVDCAICNELPCV
jgi:hypothetical protein